MGRSPYSGIRMMVGRHLHLHKIPIKNGRSSPGLLTSDEIKTNSIENNFKKNYFKQTLNAVGRSPDGGKFFYFKIFKTFKMNYATIWPQFFTASIYKRKFLLENDAYKDIIVECLKFLVTNNRIDLSAFSIMSNHVHLIWQPLGKFSLSQIQTSFMTYTSKRIKNKLLLENQQLLEQVRVNKFDRTYQIWKREPLSIELFTEKVFIQKLEYIHENPVSAGLVNYGETYKYSSAKFYRDGFDEFDILTHYTGN